MPLLPQPQILEIHATAVETRLTESREVLLAGMNLSFRASLPALLRRDEQILGDLDACNLAEKLADGSVPLKVWLINALRLAGPRVEAEVFRRALNHSGLDTEGKPLPSIPSPGAGQSWNNLPPPREFFVGRKTDLEALDRALAGGAAPCVDPWPRDSIRRIGTRWTRSPS